MARGRGRARGGGLSIDFDVEGDEELVRDLRALRRDMGRILRDESASAAKRTVLPVAVMLAPSIARGQMTIRANMSGVSLSVKARGAKRKTIGYLNFGGTVRTPIFPKKAAALRFADGTFVAAVTGPRTFGGLHFMEKAVAGSTHVYARKVASQVEGTIQQYINGRRHHRSTFA